MEDYFHWDEKIRYLSIFVPFHLIIQVKVFDLEAHPVKKLGI